MVPTDGYQTNGNQYEVRLTNGTKLTTDFVILATGQKPNNNLIKHLVPSSGDTLINPDNGFVRVRPTLQFLDSKYSNLFAVGDIADTGMHKAARPGSAQAAVAAKNIQALIEGKEPQEQFSWSPAGIHLSLGLVGIRNLSMDKLYDCFAELYLSPTEKGNPLPQSQCPGRAD